MINRFIPKHLLSLDCFFIPHISRYPLCLIEPLFLSISVSFALGLTILYLCTGLTSTTRLVHGDYFLSIINSSDRLTPRLGTTTKRFIPVANLQSQGGSKALVLASIWTGITHLGLGVLGTFVLKRFPTSFSVGFFLGVLGVLANQNLILFGTFHGYAYGNPATNHTFANVSMTLFLILTFFGLLLFHFKSRIVVAPLDAPTKARGKNEDYAAYKEGG